MGGGSLQGFSRRGQGSRASSSSSRATKGAFDVFFFRTFLGVKKVRGPPASAEITRKVIFRRALQLMESGS